MAKRTRSSRPFLGKAVTIVLPKWPVLFYACGAAVLLPWTFYLSVSLPTRALSHDWDVVWSGFDVFLIIAMLLTAYFTAHKSFWVILTSSALGTALLTDAWFDVLTARPGQSQLHSLLLAIFGEIPVAIVSWYIAIQVVLQFTRSEKH